MSLRYYSVQHAAATARFRDSPMRVKLVCTCRPSCSQAPAPSVRLGAHTQQPHRPAVATCHCQSLAAVRWPRVRGTERSMGPTPFARALPPQAVSAFRAVGPHPMRHMHPSCAAHAQTHTARCPANSPSCHCFSTSPHRGIRHLAKRKPGCFRCPRCRLTPRW